VLGPQDGASRGTGSGSALNQLTEETLYHLFDSPLGRLPSQARLRLPHPSPRKNGAVRGPRLPRVRSKMIERWEESLPQAWKPTPPS